MRNFKSSVLFSPRSWGLTFLMLLLTLSAMGQQASIVPTLVNFKGVLTDVNGKPLTGIVGVTICFYKDEQGGSPLWMETQNVAADKSGHYTVVLGSTTTQGLPTDLFASGEARWLGVQAQGQAEQPRVLLLSVPYALKAGDAQTVGGLPPSAFVLAAPGNGAVAAYTAEAATGQSVAPATAVDVTTSGGTLNYVPLWDSTSDIISSILFQYGSGTTARIGINTTTPATTLDVKGTASIRGTLSLLATGTATATVGKDSQPLNLVASAYNSTSSTALNQTFEWQAEPAGNDTTAPSGTLNLLFGEGATKPSETGLHIASDGQITFAAGQTFPGTGDGTITGITTASGSGLAGGGSSGTLTLSVPAAGISNAMLAHPSLTLTPGGGMTGGGLVALGGATTLGLKTCAASQVLEFISGAWACTNPATGTVTSVASGAGLTGGPITASGTLSIATAGVTNAMLAKPSLTVTAGTDLTGGGLVTLGGSTTLNLDTTQVPQLGAVNQFTQTQFVSVNNPFGAALQVSSGNEAIMGTGGAFGVEGQTGSSASNAYGVYGSANASSGNPIGVYGAVSAFEGTAVFGQNGTESTTATNLISGNYGAGVWGDGSTGFGFGVIGTVDDGLAGFFENNSIAGGYDTLSAYALSSTSLPFLASGPGFSSYCDVDSGGNLNCTGAKNAVVPIDGGKRIVAMSAIESPQNWFEDFGSAQLAGGVAIVTLDPDFIQTVNTEMDYKVFPVPNGDCKGLLVTHKTLTSFEVRELGGGTSSVSFDYRITAVRKNYERVRFADHTHDLDGHNRMLSRAHAAGAANQQSHMPTKNLSLARPPIQTKAVK
jgi:hypothetical protein